MGALEDAAAALKMDPVVLLKKNLALTERAELYGQQLDIASELIEWPAKWKPRTSKKGVVRSGLGVSAHTWGGGGHGSECEIRVHPDGSAVASIGTQDLGTGTRTVIAIVAAETLGIPVDAVKVNIGSNRYPPSGASGGSTTAGGTSSATRRLLCFDPLYGFAATATTRG